MSDARKRKLQAALARSTDLPESLRFTPSIEPPTNGPHAKKPRLAEPIANSPKSHEAGLLHLQTKEFLRVRRPNNVEHESLDKLLQSVKKQIKAIPDYGPVKLADIRKLSQKTAVQIPFDLNPPEDLQLNFEYTEPSEVTPDGLTSVDMLSRSSPGETDLLLEVSPDNIQEKDYLNSRIHYKLAFYKFMIASSLKAKYSIRYALRLVFGIERIVLVVEYKTRQIIIHVVVPRNSLDETKLEPSKNADRSQDGPTPVYNSSILLLSNQIALMDTIKSASEKSPNFKDSVVLADGYLSKRTLPIQVDQWALITALLLDGGGKNGGKLLSPNASALQIFRGVVLFLSQFFADVHESVSFGDAQSLPGCWTRGLNVFSGMTEQKKMFVARDLAITNDLLKDEDRNPLRAFEKIFLQRRDLIGSWDLEINITGQSATEDERERMWRTLCRALDDRATLILVIQKSVQEKSSISNPLPGSLSEGVKIGIMLNHKQCQSRLILGPAANTSGAKSFQKLWGNLAQLHRFKDGRILEAVELTMPNPTLDACNKILHLHFPAIPALDQWTVHGADRSGERALADKQKELAATFDEFARLARDLEGLPLRITSVSSSHPIFYQCSSYLPKHLDGVIRFESSARWPDDLEAIQRTKIAFLLAARDAFKSIPGVKGVQVQLENRLSMESQVNDGLIVNLAYLKVEITSGMEYHLRIHFDRELALLETFLKSPVSRSDPNKRREYETALNMYQSTYIVNDAHSQIMQNLKSRFPTLPESTLLLKQWFDTHLLCGHFSDRAIELLSLNVYMNESERQYNSAMAAFTQTLYFLSEWDWRQDALILTEDLQVYKQQAAAFEQTKAQNPGHSIILYGPSDIPPPEINRLAALRMSSLAKAASAKLQSGEDVTSTMITPLNHFDCVISLHKPKQAKYKNLQVDQSPERKISRIFIDEICQVYGESLHIFANYDASKVGILVDPALLQARRFRPNLGYPTRPSKEEKERMVVIDLDVLYDEIERLGAGVIKSMHRKR